MKSDSKLLSKLHLVILQKVYEQKVDSNPGYSIRKFAKDANIDSSTMSQYFRETRVITQPSFKKLILEFEMNEEINTIYNTCMISIKTLNEYYSEIKDDHCDQAIKKIQEL